MECPKCGFKPPFDRAADVSLVCANEINSYLTVLMISLAKIDDAAEVTDLMIKDANEATAEIAWRISALQRWSQAQTGRPSPVQFSQLI